jgi:maltooligosyltrehalose trehalohydrolase
VDYGFVLDGQGPWKDPRSPCQPYGVGGLSRTLDHDTFCWTDQQFRAPALARAVVYELHVGTFTPSGSFDAVIERLPHLVELGVTHLELMPVASFPGVQGWGYDGVDLYAPHQPYGGPEALKRLVNACHAHGLAALLDVVYNHIGPDGDVLDRYGPYFSQSHSTPWGKAFALEGPGNEEVCAFLWDNAELWLRDYHLDGLRIDAVPALIEQSATRFLQKLAHRVAILRERLGRPLVLIAESDLTDPRLVRPQELGGLGLDAQWSEDFHHALHACLTGERVGHYADFSGLAELAQALERGSVYEAHHRASRDRSEARGLNAVPFTQLFGYAQTHDQVGNRARGERLGHLVSTGLARVAAALVLTGPFVPLLFQGEEWGATTPFLYFTDHQDRKLARRVRQGRQRQFAKFGWPKQDMPDPQARETYEASHLRWEEIEQPPHHSLLVWYQGLARLRCTRSEFRTAPVRVHHDDAQRWLVVERGRVNVVANLSEASRRVSLERRVGQVLLSSDEQLVVQGSTVEVPPESVAIVEQAES